MTAAPAASSNRQALLHRVNTGCITEALRLLPLSMDSARARGQLLKTGLQESRLVTRDQINPGGSAAQTLGPALGLWQFERGGVSGVLRHEQTQRHAKVLCAARGVPATTEAVWRALKTDDVLAAGFARLNYYWHPKPLPQLDDVKGSWDYYIFCWRPGKPHEHSWPWIHNDVVAYLTSR